MSFPLPHSPLPYSPLPWWHHDIRAVSNVMYTAMNQMITELGEAGSKQSERPLLYTLYISEFFHSAVGHVYVYEHVCYNPYDTLNSLV